MRAETESSSTPVRLVPGYKTFGHHAEEVADAHRWFENLRAGLQAEPLHGLPDRLNDFGRCVMSVRRRGARRRVLFRAQQVPQFFGYALPVSRRPGFECARHRAPPGVLHEHGLFLGRCRAVFGFDSFERANSGEIGLGFLLEAALADSVGGGYSEIAGKG